MFALCISVVGDVERRQRISARISLDAWRSEVPFPEAEGAVPLGVDWSAPLILAPIWRCVRRIVNKLTGRTTGPAQYRVGPARPNGVLQGGWSYGQFVQSRRWRTSLLRDKRGVCMLDSHGQLRSATVKGTWLAG